MLRVLLPGLLFLPFLAPMQDFPPSLEPQQSIDQPNMRCQRSAGAALSRSSDTVVAHVLCSNDWILPSPTCTRMDHGPTHMHVHQVRRRARKKTSKVHAGATPCSTRRWATHGTSNLGINVCYEGAFLKQPASENDHFVQSFRSNSSVVLNGIAPSNRRSEKPEDILNAPKKESSGLDLGGESSMHASFKKEEILQNRAEMMTQ